MISSKENQQIDEILRIASEVDLKKQPLSLHEAPVYVSDDTLKEFDMTFARIKKKEEELQKKRRKNKHSICLLIEWILKLLVLHLIHILL